MALARSREIRRSAPGEVNLAEATSAEPRLLRLDGGLWQRPTAANDGFGLYLALDGAIGNFQSKRMVPSKTDVNSLQPAA
jgi:hypothetical protein